MVLSWVLLRCFSVDDFYFFTRLPLCEPMQMAKLFFRASLLLCSMPTRKVIDKRCRALDMGPGVLRFFWWFSGSNKGLLNSYWSSHWLARLTGFLRCHQAPLAPVSSSPSWPHPPSLTRQYKGQRLSQACLCVYFWPSELKIVASLYSAVSQPDIFQAQFHLHAWFPSSFI